jgi:hypothetical protein
VIKPNSTRGSLSKIRTLGEDQMSKRRIALGSLLLVTLLLTSSGAFSQFGGSGVAPVSAQTDFLSVYDGTSLTGCTTTFEDYVTDYPDLSAYSRCGVGDWDNAIRSFILAAGTSATFYTDVNFQGSAYTFYGPTEWDFMPRGFDRTVSSLKVYPIAVPSP